MAKISEVLGGAAAIAKGNGHHLYGDAEAPPLRTEVTTPRLLQNFRNATAAFMSFNATKTALRNASPASSARLLARRIASILKLHRKYRSQLRISGGERYAKVYNIDYNRCIFCGFCVEACPTDAITHGHGFEIASYNHFNPHLPQGTDAGAHPRRGAFPCESGHLRSFGRRTLVRASSGHSSPQGK